MNKSTQNATENTVVCKLPLRQWRTIVQALNDDVMQCDYMINKFDKEREGDVIDFYSIKKQKCLDLSNYISKEILGD